MQGLGRLKKSPPTISIFGLDPPISDSQPLCIPHHSIHPSEVGVPTHLLSSGLSKVIFLHGRVSCIRTICPAHLSLVILIFFLGSYRASSVRIAIRLPTDATVYFVYLFPLFLPYMFRALISPSSGVSQTVFYIQPFGSCGVYVAHLRVPVDWFVVVVSRLLPSQSHHTDDTVLHFILISMLPLHR